MTTATISDLKNRLSAFLDRVRAGETVLILDRGTPVARLEPANGAQDSDARMARLERAGIVSSGQAAPPLELIRTPGPALAEGGSAVRALLEERRSAR